MDDNIQAENQPAAWHTLTVQETIAHLEVDTATSLSDAEAARRLARFGPNQLRAEKREQIWKALLEELREPMVLLLLVTCVLYAVWGKLEDAITILTHTDPGLAQPQVSFTRGLSRGILQAARDNNPTHSFCQCDTSQYLDM